MRLARFARVRLLRHALPISLLILRKKPTVLQSSPLTASITGIQVYVNYDQEGLITIKTPSPSCFAVGS